MKSEGILNAELSTLVTKMGHGDMVVVADRGLPFANHARTQDIDLSIAPNLPHMVDVVKTVLSELEVEKAVMAEEIMTKNPEVHRELAKLFANTLNKGKPIAVEYIPHDEFKPMVLNGALEGIPVKAIVRTGECTPYANVILVSGVRF